MYIKIIIKYLLIACVCFFSKSVLAEGITLTMDFDKEEYKKGEVVNIDLKFTEVDDISINSLGIKIKYNSSILELAGNDPKQDINDGYIPFTTKANIQSNNEEACIDLMYISMFEEVRLKDGEVIASITLKVKDNAHTGVSVISIEQVNMLNDLTMFSVNAGNKREFSISITDESLDEEQKDTKYNDVPPKTNRVVKKDRIVENTVQVGIIDEGDSGSKEKSNEAKLEDTGDINHTFVDIEGHWAKDSILYLTSQEIIKGFDDNIFAPDLFIKRAEFAALIIRAFKRENKEYTGMFSDVKSESWYADIIQAAFDANLITGYAGEFRPEDYITREEIAKIITKNYRVENYYDTNEKDLEKYIDKNDISEWAMEYILKSIEFDLIKGITEIELAPKAYATRAQAAVIIHRLLISF